MIDVTRLDGSRLVVNADLIEFLEATPDTVVSLSNGVKILVREPVPDLIERVVAFKSRVGAGVLRLAAEPAADGPPAEGE